jgi:hypothetical protein
VAEARHFELRSTENVVVTAAIDPVCKQFRILGFEPIFKGCLICQEVHFKVEVVDKVLKLGFEFIE